MKQAAGVRIFSMVLALTLTLGLLPAGALAEDSAPLPEGGLPPSQTETTPTDAMDVQMIGTATVPVSGVTLDKTTISLAAGTTEQLTATVAPDSATNKTLTWESSNPSVATVDSTGLVTAVAVGTAFIAAHADDGSGQSAECAVTVTHPPNTITTALDFTGKAAQNCTNTTDIGNLHDNHTHDGGTPCWSWNPDANGSGKGALTLNGINLLAPGDHLAKPALTVPKDTTIVLTDNSTNLVKVTVAVSGADSIGLSGAGGGILTITGSGTLTAQSNQSTQKGSYGIYVGSGSELRITGNAQVNATCASSAALNSVGIFCDSSAIHISGGAKVFAQGGGSSSTSYGSYCSYGIYCATGDSSAIAVTIEGANTQVEAFGTNASTSSRNSNYGIASYGGTKILDGAAVTAKGGTAYKDSIGIYSAAALTVENATVTAIGGICNNGGTSPASESVGISGNTTLAVTNATVLAQANTCAVRWKASVTCPNASIMASIDNGSTYTTPAYLNDTNQYISLTSATTAEPAKDVKIAPVPSSYPVTLNNGGTGASGGGSHAQGATVSINAGSRSGYTFSGWTASPAVSFASPGSAVTTFPMPGAAVTVTANWTQTGGGSGGGSDRDDTSDRDTQSSYPVNDGTKQTQNGGVVLDKANARPGDTVKLSPKPEQGFDLDTIVVKDAKGKVIPVTKHADGTYSFQMPQGKVTVEATFKPAESPKVPDSGQTETGTDYTDVKQNDWYFEAVTYVSQNGLFQGDGNGRFAPNDTMTRAMLWTVVGRIDGQTLTGSTVYDDAQKWATDKGLSDGSSPGSTVTREQLITTLWRYAGSPKSDAKLDAFSDSSQVADYAKEAMAWAVERGLLQGENGVLAPHAGATRAQVAAILMRYHQAKTP